MSDTTTPVNYADLIKQDLQELADNHDVYIRVPGYDASGLQIHFRVSEPGEINKIGEKVQKQYPKKEQEYDRNLANAMDTIITLSQGFYVQPSGVDEPVMLDPDGTGVPIGFDERLAAVVGFKYEGALNGRALLRKLFDNNEVMLMMFAEKLSRWLANSKADLDTELWQMGN